MVIGDRVVGNSAYLRIGDNVIMQADVGLNFLHSEQKVENGTMGVVIGFSRRKRFITRTAARRLCSLNPGVYSENLFPLVYWTDRSSGAVDPLSIEWGEGYTPLEIERRLSDHDYYMAFKALSFEEELPQTKFYEGDLIEIPTATGRAQGVISSIDYEYKTYDVYSGDDYIFLSWDHPITLISHGNYWKWKNGQGSVSLSFPNIYEEVAFYSSIPGFIMPVLNPNTKDFSWGNLEMLECGFKDGSGDIMQTAHNVFLLWKVDKDPSFKARVRAYTKEGYRFS